MAARTLIAQYWKTSKIPTIIEWQSKLFDYLELAKLTQKIRNQKSTKFNNEWDKFKLYMETEIKGK